MLVKIAQEIAARGGRMYLVGGAVRDLLLQRNTDNEDIDVEIHGLDKSQVLQVLKKFGICKEVGKSFVTIKIKGYQQYDFSVAEPGTSLLKACSRRDFIINTPLQDILSGEIIDPLNARQDLSDRIIRPTNPGVFRDDPLRAYRAVQLAARLEFSLAPETEALIRDTPLQGISGERVYRELTKLLMLAPKPSIGLSLMAKAGILEQNHADLARLRGCAQSALHHPEGDAWQHTLLVVDQAARLKGSSKDPRSYMWAALLHDIGKPDTTRRQGDKITSYGHDLLGGKLARQFLERLTDEEQVLKRVSLLVKEHMRPVLLYKDRDKVTDRAIRKLAARVDLSELLLLAQADYLGRDIEREFSPIEEWFRDRISRLGLKWGETIAPLVQGKDLISLGLKPGPQFSKILDQAFDWQLAGQEKEEILKSIQQRWR